MDQSIQNFQELHINLCLNMYCLEDYLKTIGTKIKNNRYFIVTDDGNCWIIDPKTFDPSFCEIDCNADGKIKYLPLVSKYIKRIKIPDGIICINDYAFSGCTNLANVTIPNSVTSISQNAFAYCDMLKSVTIPNSVTRIGSGAFYYCCSLTRVTIPTSVTNIGDYAFFYCSGLKNLIFKSKTLDEVMRMDSYPFGIKDESIIHVA